MKRTAFDETRDQRIADETPGAESYGAMPCQSCRNLTPKSVLGHLGNRCSQCFATFCRGDLPISREYERELTHGDKLAILGRMQSAMAAIGRGNAKNPKAWAHALKAREVAGERLSPTQRSMWRSALGHVASENLPGGV